MEDDGLWPITKFMIRHIELIIGLFFGAQIGWGLARYIIPQ